MTLLRATCHHDAWATANLAKINFNKINEDPLAASVDTSVAVISVSGGVRLSHNADDNTDPRLHSDAELERGPRTDPVDNPWALALQQLRAEERNTWARNAERALTVSVTLQPFAFMLRDGDYVVRLPQNHRGVAWVQDSGGRFHQGLREITVQVRKSLVCLNSSSLACMPPGLYWNHEHTEVHTDNTPAIDWSWALLHTPEVAEALAYFHSPLSALRVVDVIELPLSPPFHVLEVLNFAGGRGCVYHPHMSAKSAATHFSTGHTSFLSSVHPSSELFNTATAVSTASSATSATNAFVPATFRKGAGAGVESPATVSPNVVLQARAGTLRFKLEDWLQPLALPLDSECRGSSPLPCALALAQGPAQLALASAQHAEHATGRQDLAIGNACGYEILLGLYKKPIEALQRGAEADSKAPKLQTSNSNPKSKSKSKKKGLDRGRPRHKSFQMTLKGLWAFFHPSQPPEAFDALALGLTLLEFRSFFVRFHLQLTVLDVAGAEILEASHKPLHQSRKLNPWHVWVLHHDGHLFLLHSGHHSLKMQSFSASVLSPGFLAGRLQPIPGRAPIEAANADAGVCRHVSGGNRRSTAASVFDLFPLSARCRAPSPTLAPSAFVETLDQLAGLDLARMAADGKTFLRVACPIEMTVALHQLLCTCNYEPAVNMRGHKITSLLLHVDNVVLELSPPECSPMDRTVMLQSAAEFELFRALQQNLVCALMRPQTLSLYHPEVAAAFRELPRAPLVYGTGYLGRDAFEPEAVQQLEYMYGSVSARHLESLQRTTSEHDMSKAYTAALLAMQEIPVLSVFDRFTPWDRTGRTPILDSSLYVVRRPDFGGSSGLGLDSWSPLNLLLDAEINLVTGRTLQLCLAWPGMGASTAGLQILSVLRPSRLEPATSVHAAIQKIWASELALEHKKFLPNKAVGLAGRRYQTRERTLLFRDLGEARRFHAAACGSSLLARTVGNTVLYFVHHEQRVALENGFYPVQHAVYDFMRRELFLRAVAVGRPLMAVKVDALWFAGAEPVVPKHHTLEGIGKWGVKAGLALPRKKLVVRPGTFVPAALGSCPSFAFVCTTSLTKPRWLQSYALGAGTATCWCWATCLVLAKRRRCVPRTATPPRRCLWRPPTSSRLTFFRRAAGQSLCTGCWVWRLRATATGRLKYPSKKCKAEVNKADKTTTDTATTATTAETRAAEVSHTNSSRPLRRGAPRGTPRQRRVGAASALTTSTPSCSTRSTCTPCACWSTYAT